MNVTHPKGFVAAGVAAGIKQNGKLDFAAVVNLGQNPVGAAVYTSNRAKANPILWSESVDIENTRAVVLNSGGANCFTGEFGYETTKQTANRAAHLITERFGGELGETHPAQIQVCSTGLIGAGGADFRAAVLNGVECAIMQLASDSAAGDAAAQAIMTTDTVIKTAHIEGENGYRIGAIAKGAGMLAPGLATMLVVITTDARLAPQELQQALEAAVGQTINRLDSDGCMSTNDQVTLLSSGVSDADVDVTEFTRNLTAVCDSLAAQLQADAEGASHTIDITVTGAKSERDAEEVGRALARNNLFKTAIFGNDPNWGRVLAAIGTTNAVFDPYKVDVSFNGVRLCSNGGPDRPVAECDLRPKHTLVEINLFAAVGDSSYTATIRTNDLTTDYVHENSAYSS
ncbi:bifunctional glutamate N-acetyltransferase/amino-acid acetyltransferase ArgJ [Canibacter zhoujuaniae]|uniref:bifunctional glutamate N-acetyltransferase/amino-acid acetyltransferase ArgJ n=1 Tax=Canibacter zhoujuaniae TaxID=2708343 RepID=UPI0014228299|nr:bifunctional glutamate N-acetyltransferase/amino-acid acetyltransferase ArgJ [Canibacter zhoujuaniae]